MQKRYHSILIPIFLSLFVFATTGQLGIDCNSDTPTDSGVLFQSTDSGSTYTVTTALASDPAESFGNLDITSIVQHPKDDSIVYVGTRGNGMFRSFDKGKTWTNIVDAKNQMSTSANIYEIAIDQQNPDIMYAAGFQQSRGHVFKSTDKGQTWMKSYVIPNEEFAVFALAIDPRNPSIVYIGTAEGGILRSADQGESWSLLNQFERAMISDIAINPQNTSIVYASTFDDGLLRSINGGITWIEFSSDVYRQYSGSKKIDEIAIDPRNPSTIYMASKFGILRSDDDAVTWTALSIIPSETVGVSAFAIDPRSSNTIYYGSGSIIYRSTDRGENWSVRDLPSGKEVNTITIDPKNSQHLYVGMHETK